MRVELIGGVIDLADRTHAAVVGGMGCCNNVAGRGCGVVVFGRRCLGSRQATQAEASAQCGQAYTAHFQKVASGYT